MKDLSSRELTKRLADAERRLGGRFSWNPFPHDSDHQRLRRQQHANHSLLIFIGSNLFMWGAKALVGIRHGMSFEFLVAAGLVFWGFQVAYSLVRLRWTLEAFEHFAPQTVAELRTKIDEQAAP